MATMKWGEHEIRGSDKCLSALVPKDLAVLIFTIVKSHFLHDSASRFISWRRMRTKKVLHQENNYWQVNITCTYAESRRCWKANRVEKEIVCCYQQRKERQQWENAFAVTDSHPSSHYSYSSNAALYHENRDNRASRTHNLKLQS